MEEKEKPILSVKNLSVSFKSHGKDLKVIRGISLDIMRGETFAIVGESGSGKSVFTKTFTGMLEKNGKIKSGSIVLNGVNVADPASVRRNFKDQKKMEAVLQKMESRSAHGIIAKQRSELIKRHEEELAACKVENLEGDPNSLLADRKKAIDQSFAKQAEKNDLRYSFILNSLYNKSSQNELKRQSAISKAAQLIGHVLLQRQYKYTEAELESIRKSWFGAAPELSEKMQKSRVMLIEFANTVHESERLSREEIKNLLSLASKHKQTVAKFVRIALKNVSVVLKKNQAGNGNYDIISDLYPEVIQAVTSELDAAFDIRKIVLKHQISELQAAETLKRQTLEAGRKEAYEKARLECERNADNFKSRANKTELEELQKRQASEIDSFEKKAAAEAAQKRAESTKLLAELKSLTPEERISYADFLPSDLRILNSRRGRILELQNRKSAVLQQLKEVQTQAISEFKKGSDFAAALDMSKTLGINLHNMFKQLDKLKKERASLKKESELKLHALGDDEKSRVRKELIRTETESKLATNQMNVARFEKAIIDALAASNFENSAAMRKINDDIHNVTAMISPFKVSFRKFVRLFRRDSAVDLTERGIIIGPECDLSKFKTNREWSMIRGSHIATIFQDPMTSLNPLLSIGSQISEVLRIHHNLSRSEAKAEAISLLRKVKIPDAEQRYKDYPFQYSGGMRQRVVIAIALACRPDILICDEPTTALDVTVQAQILALIKELQKEFGFTTIFITHDLGVVAGVADRIGVMYGGQIIEYGTDEDIFYRPTHPYTWALLSSLPQLAVEGEPLTYIRGNPPAFDQEIDGDAFAPRSEYAMKIDYIIEPSMTKISSTHFAKTWLLDKRAPKVKKPLVIRNLETRMKETAESFLASTSGGETDAE